MRTILIVDDERIIADGLQQVVEQIFQDELEVLNAYSATQALEVFTARRIDILLTDIQMPGTSGVELMKAVKERWPWCQVIFLTGYMVFDHVYTATQYEDVRYLLKAEGYDKILATIREVLNQITHSELTEETRKRAEQLEKENISLQRDRLLGDLLVGDLILTDIEDDSIIELGFDLDINKVVALMLFRIDLPDYEAPRVITQRNMAFLRSLTEEYLIRFLHIETHIDRYGNLAILYQPRSGFSETDCNTQVTETLDVILEKVKMNLGFTASVITGTQFFRFAELHPRYLELHYCLNYVNFDAGERVLRYPFGLHNTDGAAAVQGNMKSSGYLFQLEQFLVMGDEEEFNKTLHRVLELYSSEQTAGYCLVSAYYRISLMLLDHMSMQKGGSANALALLSDMERTVSWREAGVFLQNLSGKAFAMAGSDYRSESQGIIGQVVEHIASNIGSPSEITLSSLSEKVFLSPSYLSRMFRTETGVRLSEYISRQRMEVAKNLLTDPNKRINDVAQELGFDIPSNFTRFFKKHSGVTPLDYQRIINE